MISLYYNSLNSKGKIKNTGVVHLGFRRGANEVFALLEFVGSYAAFIDIYRLFRTTHLFHLQQPSSSIRLDG